METRISTSLGLLTSSSRPPLSNPSHFPNLFTHFTIAITTTSLWTTLILAISPLSHSLRPPHHSHSHSHGHSQILRPKVRSLMKSLSVFECALIGSGASSLAGAFTCVYLLPLHTVKTELQTKGTSEINCNAFDAIAKTFQTKGIMGFYSGVSTVIVGTCEFGKSFLSKI